MQKLIRMIHDHPQSTPSCQKFSESKEETSKLTENSVKRYGDDRSVKNPYPNPEKLVSQQGDTQKLYIDTFS